MSSKWNKTHLICYFPQANGEYRKLAKKAFKYWEDNSNLKFSNIIKPTLIKPDITITIQRRNNFFEQIYQGRHKWQNIK